MTKEGIYKHVKETSRPFIQARSAHLARLMCDRVGLSRSMWKMNYDEACHMIYIKLYESAVKLMDTGKLPGSAFLCRCATNFLYDYHRKTVRNAVEISEEDFVLDEAMSYDPWRKVDNALVVEEVISGLPPKTHAYIAGCISSTNPSSKDSHEQTVSKYGISFMNSSHMFRRATRKYKEG